jgi:hypothetical protein
MLSQDWPAGSRVFPRGTGTPWLRGLLVIVLGGWLAATALPAEELHTFTDQQGRTLKAEIENVIGQDVSLKREDGENFKVKIEVFIDADQDYIRQWAIQQAVDDRGMALTLTALPWKSSSVTAQTGDMTEEKWQEGYKLTVENETSMELQKIRVEYQIFKDGAVPGALDPSTDPVTRAAGSVILDLVPPNGSETLDTLKVPMTSYALMSGYTWGTGANRDVTDNLLGIWVRVYSPKGDLIQEWASSSSLQKKQKWDDGSGKKPVPGGGED